MKSIKNIWIAIAILLTCSCKKFLEETPTNFLTPESQLSSSKVARALADGAYQNLQSSMLGGQPSSYGGNTWNLMEFVQEKPTAIWGKQVL